MKLNINTATQEEFIDIPGFGESVAGKIVQYRKQHGPFQTFDELKGIPGIGEKKLQKIKSECTLGSQPNKSKYNVNLVSSAEKPRPRNDISFSSKAHQMAPYSSPLNVAGVKLNLNSATVEDIVNIPGFGESVARKILQHRKQHGPFQNFGDLESIPGIGEAKLQAIKSKFTLGSQKVKPELDANSFMSEDKSQMRNVVHKSLAKTKNNRSNDIPSSSKTQVDTLLSNSRFKVEASASRNVKPSIPQIQKESGTNKQRPNLNIATTNELSDVPGISEELAGRIVSFREKYGEFFYFEDLRCVHSLGESKLEILKKHFCISSVTTVKSRSQINEIVSEEVKALLPYVRDIVYPNQICHDMTTDGFKRIVIRNNLMILHVNIVSLNKRIDDLRDLVSSMNHSPDVICLSETSNPKNLENVQLHGYAFYCKHSTQKSGGVGIYVKEKHTHSVRHNLQFDIPNCENIWIEVKSTTPPIIVGAVYRHPRRTFGEFPGSLIKTVQKIKKENKLFYILGDININMRDSHKEVGNYCDLLKKNGCKLTITIPTRRQITRSGDSNTLIDHIYTNNKEKRTESGVVFDCEISDHCPIYCILKT